MELFEQIMQTLHGIGLWVWANPLVSVVAVAVLLVGATILRPLISLVRSLLGVAVLALLALLLYSWLQ